MILLAFYGVACGTGASGRANSDPDAGTPPPVYSITPRPFPVGRQGTAYGTTIQIAGDPPADLRWSISAGALPPGVALTIADRRSASLSGTPTTAGDFPFTVAVDAPSGERRTASFSLQIIQPLRITDLVEGVEGEPFDQPIALVGDPVGPVDWTVSSGSLPPGLQLVASATSASVQGTPAPGIFNFTILAVDADGSRAEHAYALRIRSNLRIDGDPAASGTERVPYQASLQVHGGVGSGYHWGFRGGVPPGMSLQAELGAPTLLLTGTPVVAGLYSFMIGVSDDLGGFAERAITVTIGPGLAVIGGASPTGRLGADYSVTFSATGGSGTAYQWVLDSGTIPPGLLLTSDGASATVSGRPTHTGSFQFVVVVALSLVERVAQSVQIDILPNPPVFTTTALPGGTWGTAYSTTIAATSPLGGPFTWQLTGGALPPGVHLIAADAPAATLSGTPLQVGTFQFTVSLADAGGTASASYTIDTSVAQGLEVLARTFPPARAGRVFSAPIATRGAQGAVSWQLAGGQLPPGLDLVPDAAGASLQGTPTQDGFYRFTIGAADEAGAAAQQSFSVHVAPSRWWLAAVHRPGFSGAWTFTVRDVSTATPGPVIDVLPDFMSGSSFVQDILFSPDPDLLSFWDFSRKTLFLADLRGTPAVVQLAGRVRPDRSRPLRWAPDGTHFAYATEPVANSFVFTHFVGEVGASGVATSQVLTCPCDYVGQWSPDSTRYATSSADARTIFVADASTTRAIPIPAGLRLSALVSWAPDSERLIFTAFDSQFVHRAYVVDVTADPAEPFAVTPPDVGIDSNSIQVSPDAGTITVNDRSDVQLWAVDVRSPQIGFARRVADTLARTSALWSPDSRLLAINAFDGNAPLFFIDRDQIGLSAALPLGGGVLPLPGFATAWSPDSQRLLYDGFTAGAYAVAIDGGAADHIVADQRFPAIKWLDSHVAIYAAPTGLAAIDVAIPAPSSPVVLDPSTPTSWDVAPARKAVFYWVFVNGVGTSKLWMVDLAGSTATSPSELLDLGSGTVNFSVSDDGFVGQ